MAPSRADIALHCAAEADLRFALMLIDPGLVARRCASIFWFARLPPFALLQFLSALMATFCSHSVV